MTPGVSVIICTHNGARLLPETLCHIALQQVHPEIAWEVIVVNNASTDNTPEVVKSEWAKLNNPAPLMLLYQPRKGLSRARQTGLRKASYEFILFCDDDNWLNPDYIKQAYDLMVKHPSIGVLGGHGELEFETPPPLWAVGLKALASGAQAKASGKVRHNAVYGAGCVVRGAAIRALSRADYKPLLTDRKGSTLSAGGDYELCYAIALAGYDIWYDEQLRFKHFMPDKRINKDYLTQLFRDGAKSFEILIPYRIRINMNGKSMAAFYLKSARVIYFYLKKAFPLLLNKVRFPAGSEQAQRNDLKLLSLKYKLLSFKNYAAMRQNFSSILKLEKGLLSSPGATADGEPYQSSM